MNDLDSTFPSPFDDGDNKPAMKLAEEFQNSVTNLFSALEFRTEKKAEDFVKNFRNSKGYTLLREMTHIVDTQHRQYRAIEKLAKALMELA